MQYGLQYLRPINDIHLDFDVANGKMPWKPPGLPEDHLSALLISGDIWHAKKMMSYANESWIGQRAQRFRYVIFVLGNHDYWDGALNYEPTRIKELIQEMNLKNVFLLERDTLVLEDVKFVGGTLWTDFNKQDPNTMFSANKIMVPDYTRIKKRTNFVNANGESKIEYRKIQYQDFLNVHLETKRYIFENAIKDEKTRKLVVMTHMAPSCLSIADQYKEDFISNGYYYSELGNEIAGTDIDYWFHGHTHTAMDYMINKTRVINNARGYAGYEFDNQFEPEFLITL